MERDLEDKARANPSSRLFAPLADSYRKKGRIELAIRTLQEGLTSHPSYVTARVLLARCHEDLGEWQKAREEWKKILELDPGNLVALRGVGEVSLRLGELEEARGWYRLFLEEIPDDPEIRERLRVIEEAIGDRGTLNRGGGETEVERGVAPAEGSAAEPSARPGESRDESRSGPVEPPEDEGLLPAGEGLDGEDSVQTTTLAEIYAQQGFIDRAIEIYRKILARDPVDERIRERIDRLKDRLRERAGENPPAGEGEPESRLKPDFLRQRMKEGAGQEGDREPSTDAGPKIDTDRVERPDLDENPGTGPVIARDIGHEGEGSPPCAPPEDVARVPDIGERTIDGLRSYLVFEQKGEPDAAGVGGPARDEGVRGEEAPSSKDVVGRGGSEDARKAGNSGMESEFEEFRRWLKNLRK